MVDSSRRFGGLTRLYGVDGATRIRESHIVIVGIGGVGSWSAEALARSGTGQLTLIDLDHVSESNVNRQIHATENTIGQAKVLAMRDRIATFNPQCQVNCVEDFVSSDNWLDLLQGEVHAVIDACDQVRAKATMASWAREAGGVFITVGAAGGKRYAHQVEIDDLSAVTHDPLLSQLRSRLRKEYAAPREGKRIGVASVFSREPVKLPDNSCSVDVDSSLNCHGYGSVVAVTATFGHCAAGWVLDQISKSPTSNKSKIRL